MEKPKSIRETLIAHHPHLRDNPDNLRIYIPKGAPAMRFGANLSYRQNYTLTIAILNFKSNAETVFFPILQWIVENQPNLLLNFDQSENPFSYEIDFIDNETFDLELTIELSETIKVTPIAGGHSFETLPELDPNFDNVHYSNINTLTIRETPKP